jgi:predicted transcriptional regulator
MACINADGTLTPIAQKVLSALEAPSSVSEISQRSRVPLYRVRASVRELADLGMLEEYGEIYYLTSKGTSLLSRQKE